MNLKEDNGMVAILLATVTVSTAILMIILLDVSDVK